MKRVAGTCKLPWRACVKASEHNSNKVARWLSQLSVGDEIPQDLYQVIAEILAFVYMLEGKTPASADQL